MSSVPFPPGQIADPNVQELVGVAGVLEAAYVAPAGTDPWEGSPFRWIKGRPSSQVGAIGEKLVEGWCVKKGLLVRPTGDRQADRVIEGHRVEIKFSTLWEGGFYKFQQVRDQDYEFLFCLGISPFDAHGWLVPKTVLFDYVIGHTGQHTGASGMDTAWIQVDPSVPPSWMAPYGGHLADVWRVLSALSGGV